MKRRMLVLVGALALVAAACGGGGDDSASNGATTTSAPAASGGSVEAGLELYQGTCKTCHADAGVGIEGLGKPLAGSAFVAGMSEAELVQFLKVGRDTSDPENTSGVSMPPKGGNPALTDADLASIAAYLLSLN